MPHTHLYWRPVNHEGEYLGYDLKWALARRLWHSEGSTVEDWVEVDKDLVPFLEGVVAGAGSENALADEARTLIKLLKKHGSVEICLKND